MLGWRLYCHPIETRKIRGCQCNCHPIGPLFLLSFVDRFFQLFDLLAESGVVVEQLVDLAATVHHSRVIAAAEVPADLVEAGAGDFSGEVDGDVPVLTTARHREALRSSDNFRPKYLATAAAMCGISGTPSRFFLSRKRRIVRRSSDFPMLRAGTSNCVSVPSNSGTVP